MLLLILHILFVLGGIFGIVVGVVAFAAASDKATHNLAILIGAVSTVVLVVGICLGVYIS